MRARETETLAVPTARPVVTTYLKDEFYKTALQWLAQQDDRSVAYYVGKLIENKVDEAIASNEIPSEVLEQLRAEIEEAK
ncbi:MAG: hypothetical protein ACFB0C_20310 [Leptolyngbyaceae cyanobacterium]